MGLFKIILDIIKGNAIIITLNEDRKLNCVKGQNLSIKEAKIMSLKIAEIL